MNWGKNEGPSNYTIPQQSFTTCSGCKYYSHHLVKSGRDPIYANSCEHPEINPRDSWRGNLHENHLGVVVTPDWCPFKKENSTTLK
jgi:hypothetical protein